jgi:hypothetical protein
MDRRNKFPRNCKINKIAVSQPWEFPPLSPGGTGKIITRHFTNLVLTLHRDPLALLSFLIYQSGPDNTVQYSTKLLKQFDAAVTLIQERHHKKKISKSLPSARRSFKLLIEYGMVYPAGKKLYLINPRLCYSKLYVKPTFYKDWVEKETNEEQIQAFITHARGMVEKHK